MTELTRVLGGYGVARNRPPKRLYPTPPGGVQIRVVRKPRVRLRARDAGRRGPSPTRRVSERDRRGGDDFCRPPPGRAPGL